MSVRKVLTWLRPGNGPKVVIECRNCGTTIEPRTEDCPDCGQQEFIHYEIPE